MLRRRADVIAVTTLALLATIWFADVLIGVNQFYMRDLTRYYYPTKQILREIVYHGEFPYWNRYFSAGQPMAANPEHEVFYPLTWLILLPSYDLGYRLHILVHIWIGLIGMYALLRSMELRIEAALLGAITWGLGGLVMSYVNLLPILFCAAWLPLTCLFTRRFLLRPNKRDFALSALFLGLQFLVSEPTTVAQTGLPAWVRARALSVYLLVFQGAMALGSVIWGEIASRFGLRTTLFIAGVALLVGAAVTVRPRLIGSKDVDTRPSLHWPPPDYAIEPKPEQGPVLVTIEYRIYPKDREPFLSALEKLARERRRDGAYAWGVFEDAADQGRMIETFLVESWLEHLRQHERVTNADRVLQETIQQFQTQGAPKITHLIAADRRPAERKSD